MNDHAITTAVSIILAIAGLSVIAVLVSSGANTTGVLTSSGGAIQRALCVALSPVTGGACGVTSTPTTATSSGVNYNICPIPGQLMVNGVCQ